jgi:hypothetical protein
MYAKMQTAQKRILCTQKGRGCVFSLAPSTSLQATRMGPLLFYYFIISEQSKTVETVLLKSGHNSFGSAS